MTLRSSRSSLPGHHTKANTADTEIRTAPHPDGKETPPRTNDRVWAKVRVPVPADPMLHACLPTFVADIGAGFGDVVGPGIPLFGPSIDFSVWFHGS